MLRLIFTAVFVLTCNLALAEDPDPNAPPNPADFPPESPLEQPRPSASPRAELRKLSPQGQQSFIHEIEGAKNYIAQQKARGFNPDPEMVAAFLRTAKLNLTGFGANEAMADRIIEATLDEEKAFEGCPGPAVHVIKPAVFSHPKTSALINNTPPGSEKAKCDMNTSLRISVLSQVEPKDKLANYITRHQRRGSQKIEVQEEPVSTLLTGYPGDDVEKTVMGDGNANPVTPAPVHDPVSDKKEPLVAKVETPAVVTDDPTQVEEGGHRTPRDGIAEFLSDIEHPPVGPRIADRVGEFPPSETPKGDGFKTLPPEPVAPPQFARTETTSSSYYSSAGSESSAAPAMPAADAAQNPGYSNSPSLGAGSNVAEFRKALDRQVASKALDKPTADQIMQRVAPLIATEPDLDKALDKAKAQLQAASSKPAITESPYEGRSGAGRVALEVSAPAARGAFPERTAPAVATESDSSKGIVILSPTGQATLLPPGPVAGAYVGAVSGKAADKKEKKDKFGSVPLSAGESTAVASANSLFDSKSGATGKGGALQGINLSKGAKTVAPVRVKTVASKFQVFLDNFSHSHKPASVTGHALRGIASGSSDGSLDGGEFERFEDGVKLAGVGETALGIGHLPRGTRASSVAFFFLSAFSAPLIGFAGWQLWTRRKKAKRKA